MVESLLPVCALALTGDLTVSGSGITTGTCALASNASDTTAIDVTGGLTATTLTAVGGCCGPVTVSVAVPAGPYHPPTPNPFTNADAIAFPAFSGATCAPPPIPVGGVITPTAYETAGQANCSDITLAAGQTLQFSAPGTYIFYNASLAALAGTLQCFFCHAASPVAGINIVFIGTSPATTGTLTIGPIAVVSTINAAANNPTFPGLSGILFYGQGSSPVSISLLSPSPAPIGRRRSSRTPPWRSPATRSNVSCLSLVAA